VVIDETGKVRGLACVVEDLVGVVVFQEGREGGGNSLDRILQEIGTHTVKAARSSVDVDDGRQVRWVEVCTGEKPESSGLFRIVERATPASHPRQSTFLEVEYLENLGLTVVGV